MANEIQADPAKLRKHAESIQSIRQTLQNNIYSGKAQIDSLKGVWTGEAAGTFNASFTKLLAGCEDSIKTVGNMAQALYESADAYDRNEKAVQQEASKMPKLPTNTMR